jgi:hypothetical protein
MNNLFITRRRDLLPIWMKIFIWIFIVLGASAIITRLSGIFGISFLFFNANGEKSIYGMTTYDSSTPLALLITGLIIYKGITALAMWMEKEWAITMALVDAVLGIAVCAVMMFMLPMVTKEAGRASFNFRFELLLLIPYLLKCWKIRQPWEESNFSIEAQPISTVNEIVPVVEKEEVKPADNTVEEVKEEKSEDDDLDKEDYRRFMPK